MAETTELLPLVSSPPPSLSVQVDEELGSNAQPPQAEKVDSDAQHPQTEKVDSKAVDAPNNETSVESPSQSDVAANPTETQAERVARFRHGNLDNLRVVLITLLTLQHAVLVTVSSSPDPFKLHETAPKSFTTLTLFVTFTRTVVVGMLFFLSGFASRSTSSLETVSMLNFAVWKTLRTALEAGGYYLSIVAVRYLYGPAPESGAYYATQTGRNAIMHGPLFYVGFLLVLDYIFAIGRASSRLIWGSKSSWTHLLRTPTRYLFATIGIYGVLQLMMTLRAYGIVRPSEKIKAWLYLADSAELHAPFLYVITYTSGLYFIPFHKISFRCMPGQRWPMLIFYFLGVFGALHTIYNDLPDVIPQYLDIRVAPHLGFFDGINDPKNFATKYFVLWTTWVTWIIPPTVVGSFYVIPFLKRPFSDLKRKAYIQTHIHMIFVIGIARGAGWIDNLLWRCVYVGTAAIVCGWLTVLVPIVTLRSVKAAWKKRSSGIALSDQEEV